MKRTLLLAAVVLAIALALAFLALLSLLSGSGPNHGAAILSWKLAGALPERAPGAPFALLDDAPPLTLAEVYSALRAARRDPSLSTIAVTFGEPDFGLAKAEEVRRLLGAVRDAGKDLECYLETAGEGSNGTLVYFLATACSKISIAPAGELNLLGLYADGVFLRSTLDKLQIQPNFSSAGIYKSAIETYTRTDHSPAAEAAIGAVLDHHFELIVRAISERRKLSPARVLELIGGAPYSAADAVRLGLVDRVLFPDEFEQQYRATSGEDEVDLKTYATQSAGSGGTVAVVFAEGGIARGESGSGGFTGQATLGSDDFAETLRQVRDDASIDAVVLRVDSPGGSALASDLILRELDLLAQKKPLVASLSDVAASGGYYIVSHAPTIVAESSTITGSIGVFSGKLVTGGLERNVLGITRDPLKRGANSDLYSSAVPFSRAQARSIQAAVERTYETFLAHVATGRKLTRDEVHAVAQGRIWTGQDAERHKLVDHLGGLDRAIALALQAAKLPEETLPRLRYYPEPPSVFDLLMDQQQAMISLDVRAVTDLLVDQPARLLELPEELAHLSRPFS